MKQNLKIKIVSIVYNLSWFLVRPFILLIFRPKFFNVNVINETEPPVIFASNHKSLLDSWIIGSAFPFRSKFFPIIWLAAEKYFKMPIVSFIIRIYGSIPAKKGIGLKNSLKEAIYYLKEKKLSIGIFPEGKVIFEENKIDIFKRGIGYLFSNTKNPIVPIAIRLSKRFEFSDLITLKNRAYVFFGRPIYDIKGSYEEIADYLQKVVKDLFDIKDYYIEKSNPTIELENPNLLSKTSHFIIVPFLNSKIFSRLVRIISKEGRMVSQKPGSALSMEIVYNLPKKNFFSAKSLNETSSIIFDRLLFQTKALRNRLKIVKNLIKESLYDISNKKEIKILSLGGGSCRSIISAISEISKPEIINKITIYNIDNDPESNYLSTQVKKEFRLDNLKLEIINEDLLVFFKNPQKYISDIDFDLIEIVGIFDYLEEEEVINYLNNIYNLLKNEGYLIFSNIAPNNEAKFLENIGWPRLYYRNIVDWIYILKNKSSIKSLMTCLKKEK